MRDIADRAENDEAADVIDKDSGFVVTQVAAKDEGQDSCMPCAGANSVEHVNS